MKRKNKILPEVIFLLLVLFCTGIKAYSICNIQTTIIEHPAMENCVENNSLSDVDIFDDEQINQISDFSPEVNYVFQIRISQNCVLISSHPTPIWQPPKNVSFNV